MIDNDIFRQTFNTRAKLYNEIRPVYPTDLFDSLVKAAQLSQAAHLLEIGPGTGQATAGFAERGFRITAVELGDALAEIARRQLARHPKVDVITSAFEEVELPPNSFDLIYSATAFHWIKKEVKFVKPHLLLRDHGHLAIISTNHISDGAYDEFIHKSQSIYDKYQVDRRKSAKDSKSPILRIEAVLPDEFDNALFEPIFFEVFPMVIGYSANSYVKLISTFSSTLVMARDRREEFLSDIRDLIDSRFDGHLMKPYGMSLTVARKK